MIITLYHSHSWKAKIVRWFTRSRYSHCGIITSAALHYQALDRVVFECFLAPEKGEVIELYHVNTTAEQDVVITNFLNAQAGREYDWRMIFAFFFRGKETRASRKKWFCSELVFAALAAGGVKLLERVEAWRVTPDMIASSPLLTRAGEVRHGTWGTIRESFLRLNIQI